MKLNKTSANMQKTTLRRGSFMAGATAIVIVICVLINILVAQIPSTKKQIDISGTDIYKISDTSKEIISGLSSNVEITVLADETKMDQRITRFLEKYCAESSKLSVSYVDTVMNPGILKNYEGSSAGSVIVSCPDTGKYRVVRSSGFNNGTEGIINFDYYAFYQYYVSYGQERYDEVSFDGDGQITSAVNYVTSDVADAKVYKLGGHGQSELPATILSLFTKNYLEVADTIDLLMSETGIPEDCDLLLDVAPTTDLSVDELNLLHDYLANGGKYMLMLSQNSFANYNSLCAEFGLNVETAENAFVADQSNYYAQFANVSGYMAFNPVLSSSSDITKTLSGSNALIMGAIPVTEGAPASDSVVLDAFMTSSSNSVIFSGEYGTETNTFLLGAAAEDSTTGARFTMISTTSVVNENITVNYPNMVNSSIFMNAVTANFDEIESLNIDSVNLKETYNTINGALLWLALFVIVVPVVILVFGIVHWIVRRRK